MDKGVSFFRNCGVASVGSRDECLVFSTTFRLSDKGLTLRTPALETLYGGQITLSTLLIKSNIRLSSVAFDRSYLI